MQSDDVQEVAGQPLRGEETEPKRDRMLKKIYFLKYKKSLQEKHREDTSRPTHWRGKPGCIVYTIELVFPFLVLVALQLKNMKHKIYRDVEGGGGGVRECMSVHLYTHITCNARLKTERLRRECVLWHGRI